MSEHAPSSSGEPSSAPLAIDPPHDAEPERGFRFVSTEVALRRAPQRFGVLDAALLLIAPMAFAISVWQSESPIEPVAFALLPFLVAQLARRLARPVERLGRVALGPLGLFFNGERLAPSRGIAIARVITGEDAPIVVLSTRAGRVHLRLRGAAEVQRLSAALVIDDGARRVVRLPSRMLTDPGQFARFGLYAVLATVAFPVVGLTWHVNANAALVLLGVAFVAVVAILVAFMADTTIELTSDGLRVRWLRGSRFLPFGEIATVDLHQEAADIRGSRRRRVLVVVTKTGEVLRLPCDEADAEAMAEMLRHTRRGLAGTLALPTERAVESGGRGPREWLRALRALASGAGASHRRAPIAEDALYRVLDDEGAPAEARAGAAIALVAALGEDAKTRVRIAALTASPRLRVAFEAATAESDAEIEAALGELTSKVGPQAEGATEPTAASTLAR